MGTLLEQKLNGPGPLLHTVAIP